MGDMKFFIENQKIGKEVEWVKKQVRLHMNGAATSQMEKRGIHYRENYGVAVPHLKQLAKRVPSSYELAERLWFMEIRETMLLAALLVPAEEMTLERCKEWGMKIDNKDLVERTAMYLWPRLDASNQLMSQWMHSDNPFWVATALYTIGRQLQTGILRAEFSVETLIDVQQKHSEQLIYQAGSFALRMYMRQFPSAISFVKTFVVTLKETGVAAQLAMAEELMAEIEFLEESSNH